MNSFVACCKLRLRVCARPRLIPCVYTTVPDRKSTRLNSSHSQISYAVFCLKKKNNIKPRNVWLRHTRLVGSALVRPLWLPASMTADRSVRACDDEAAGSCQLQTRDICHDG